MDPPTVQCDGCGATRSHPRLSYAVILSGIIFNRRHPGRRLCVNCRKTEGWDEE